MTGDALVHVLSSTPSKGSGFGMSYYGTRCGRKANLNALHGGDESGFDAKVGTLFHKLEEMYYSNLLNSTALPISDDPEAHKTDPVQEALRMFAQYVQIFPKNEFTTLACEYFFPQTEEHEKLITAAVGITPYTGRIDRVVHVSDQQVPGIRERRGVQLAPGWYLMDTKTKKQKSMDIIYDYELSHQFALYQMVWDALFPDQRMKGMLVNQVIRHQDLTKKEDGLWRSFKTFLVEPPTEHRKEVERAYLKRKKDKIDRGEVDLDACLDWGVCHHYLNGNCNRL